MEALLRTASYCFPVYAFTNSNPSHQSVWSTKLELELTSFRSVFVSSELGMRKPDRDAYLEVAARAGHHLSEFLFFDDSPENSKELALQECRPCSRDRSRTFGERSASWASAMTSSATSAGAIFCSSPAPRTREARLATDAACPAP
jgi:hypothetical protein